MTKTSALVRLLVGSCAISVTAGFVVPKSSTGSSVTISSQTPRQWGMLHAAASELVDCGCGEPVRFSGKPSDRAKLVNPRQILRESRSNVYNIRGEAFRVEDLLEEHSTNVVVFLRSFG